MIEETKDYHIPTTFWSAIKPGQSPSKFGELFLGLVGKGELTDRSG
jgi:hypothetical protein